MLDFEVWKCGWNRETHALSSADALFEILPRTNYRADVNAPSESRSLRNSKQRTLAEIKSDEVWPS